MCLERRHPTQQWLIEDRRFGDMCIGWTHSWIGTISYVVLECNLTHNIVISTKMMVIIYSIYIHEWVIIWRPLSTPLAVYVLCVKPQIKYHTSHSHTHSNSFHFNERTLGTYEVMFITRLAIYYSVRLWLNLIVFVWCVRKSCVLAASQVTSLKTQFIRRATSSHYNHIYINSLRQSKSSESYRMAV